MRVENEILCKDFLRRVAAYSQHLKMRMEFLMLLHDDIHFIEPQQNNYCHLQNQGC